MARLERVQSNFTKGALSPRIRGRIDFEGYFDGAKRLENLYVLVQGGAMRRSGSRFVAEVKNSANRVRLIGFEPVSLQSYVIEAGPSYQRFFVDEALLLDAGHNITAVNQGTKTFTITGDHTAIVTPDDPVTVSGSTGNNGNYIVTAVALNGPNTDVTVRQTIPSAVADGVMAIPHEVTTPYTASDLTNIVWAQSNDILYIAHRNHRPRELRRTSPTQFTLTLHDFLDGPYLPTNLTATTINLNPAGGPSTITTGTTGVVIRASATTGINNDAGFSVDDIDRLIRVGARAGGGETWLQITGFTSTTEVTGTLRGDNATRNAPTTNWRLGEWHGPTNWPDVVGLNDERLWWGSNDDRVSTFWVSKRADFPNHEPNAPATQVVAADNAINVTIANNSRSGIRWFASTDQGMLVGTSSAEVIVRGPGDALISPLNIEVRQQTNYGARRGILPVRIGRSVVFVQRDGRMLRDAAFDFDRGGFIAEDITPNSEHFFRRGINRIVYAQSPIPLLWALTNPSRLVALTVEPRQQVLAWHEHPVADSSAGGGEIEDIQVMREGPEDQLWLVYKRTINGVTKRYVEFIETLFEEHLDIKDAFFVDSGLTGVAGSPTTTFSGFNHLEGQSIAVLADGSRHPNVTVTNGTITLQRAATKIQAGLATRALVELLPWDGSRNIVSAAQTTTGKVRRAFQIHIRFDNTVGAKVGPTEADASEIIFRMPTDPMDQPVPRFTGTKSKTIKGRHEQEVTTVIFNDQPLPFHVLNVTEEMELKGS